MAKSRRDRKRAPARRRPFRDPKPLILIVCEGEITEPEYFHGFRNACRNPRVDIKVPDKHGDPKKVVEIAIALQRENARRAEREGDPNLAYDAVWCVFDVDRHERLDEALRTAEKNGLRVAVSNPCFELWLLLHFRDNPGMQPCQKLCELLAKRIPQYNKHVDFSDCKAGYFDAVARANELDGAAAAGGEPGRNPTSGVHRLTESIREDGPLI